MYTLFVILIAWGFRAAAKGQMTFAAIAAAIWGLAILGLVGASMSDTLDSTAMLGYLGGWYCFYILGGVCYWLFTMSGLARETVFTHQDAPA